MGNETGTFSYADFCYDSEALHMTCQVYRREPRSAEPFPDGVNFYVESKGASTDVPIASAYRFGMLPDGTLSVSKGNGSGWTQTELPAVQVASNISGTNYRLEVAIPWSAIGLSAAPVGQNLSVNIEILTGDGTQQIVERIPDASATKPATWMPLKLIAGDPTGIGGIGGEGSGMKREGTNSQGNLNDEPNGIYDLSGRQIISELVKGQMVNGKLSHGIYIQSGKKFAKK